MLRRLFTDDDTARRIEGVPVVELPPAHKRDAHRAEVAGADGAVNYVWPLIRRRIGNAFDCNAHRVTVVGERQVARDGDRLHARQWLHPPNNFIEECRPPCRVRVFHFRQIDAKREQVIGPETRIEIAQMHETVDQQTCANEEND